MVAAVVDTNVAVVANGAHEQATDLCRLICTKKLISIRKTGIAVVDNLGLIFDEYKKHFCFSGQPGVGDAFFKHIHNNLGNAQKVEIVTINPTDENLVEFEEFPDDPDLVGFDKTDRKFVAVAIKSTQNPSILNAVDSGWEPYRQALLVNGVTVLQLCPDSA